ncbi:hypothetical protein K8R47_04210, partial [archaeon]|nr:hypothetical protein [archaeon]
MEFSQYFLDKNKKKHFYLKLNSSNKKIITFSWIAYDFSFDNFVKYFNYKLLKTEVMSKDTFYLFKKFIKLYFDNDSSIPTFWCLKKENLQYLGISLGKFSELIQKKEGFEFAFPFFFRDQNIILVFKGVSGRLNTYKLFVYFNNNYVAYIDVINNFINKIKRLDSSANLKQIKEIKIKESRINETKEETLKLKYTCGFLDYNQYLPFYFFIHNPKNKKNSSISNLSHIIVSCNNHNIDYDDK